MLYGRCSALIFKIENEYAGKTLLYYLKSVLKISSSSISSLKCIEHGIEVNGAHVTVRYILRSGDLLSLNLADSADEASENILPIDLPIDIVFEDDNTIIVNKPPYMPTHPSHDHINDTLANALAYRYSLEGIPFVFRPTGRLDRNTSGLVVLAKSRASSSYLFGASKRREIQKHYIAILSGELGEVGLEGTVHSYIKRRSDSIIMRTSSDFFEDGAKEALTNWKILYSGSNISVVLASPVTGRTHQIRVHFASLGYPLLGDDLYGSGSPFISRHALHSAVLSLSLPFDGSSVSFFAPPPEDMCHAFEEITGKSLSDLFSTEAELLKK